MSDTTMVASGSHQASGRGRYTPAQKNKAYAALKFKGSNPGHRVSANTSINATGSQTFDFSFTHRDDTPRRRGDKPRGGPASKAGQCVSPVRAAGGKKSRGEKEQVGKGVGRGS